MISDIELKTIEKRLDGIKEGVQRLRTILIITIIASSAILFVLFNSNFSRIHSMAVDESGSKVQSEGKTFAKLGKEILLSDWYKSRNIQVNFLGISVNVTDLPIVGSITLTVITIWYFYGYRQSNRAIYGILEDVSKYKRADRGLSRKEIIGLRKMVYTSIAQTSVFTKNDTLRPAAHPPSQNGTAGGGKGRAKRVMPWLERRLLGESDRPSEYKPGENAESEALTFTDKLVKFMFYLPFWTTLSILMREVYNLLSYSPLQDSAMNEREVFATLGLAPPLQNLSAPEQLSAFETFVESRQVVSMYIEGHYGDIALAFLFGVIALLFVIYLRVLCNGCLAFSRANTQSLWRFNVETTEMEEP
ncbi:MAG: hypothetical protein JOZ96_21240 [Acidobacteria bacterium]|nr:hypothetical protein [Acidobacteriota bacterium]